MEIELTETIHEGDFCSGKYKSAVFHYLVHIPAAAQDRSNLGLIVTHDGLNRADAYAAEILAETGLAPYCVTIGVKPGNLFVTVEDGRRHYLRASTYDMFLSAYPEFIVEELVPYLTEKYNLKISDSAAFAPRRKGHPRKQQVAGSGNFSRDERAISTGKIYKRKLENRKPAVYDVQTQPGCVLYYD